MTTSRTYLVCLLAVLVFVPKIAAAQSNSAASVVLVDDDKMQCPTAEFTSIQSAVNAARHGDVIRVCPGTYHEQVIIEKTLTIEGDNGAIVMPVGVTANATNTASGDAIAAIIVVQNADSVDVSGLIVDGSNNGIAQCSPVLMGILYQNSSGTIKDNAVRHMKLSPSDSGCQSGDGIFVEGNSGANGTVKIVANSVEDYQKNGITGDESGTQVNIRRNAVTGMGPTTGAGENGIQIGFGARGAIVNNTVANNIFSPCVSTTDCSAVATGILVFQSNGVEITNNSVGTNQVGIDIQGNDEQIKANTVYDSIVFDGIDAVGDDNQVSNNTITHSDEDGIFLQGNSNTIDTNMITDASVGIFKVAGSASNAITGNTFHAAITPVVDPASPRIVGPAPAR